MGRESSLGRCRRLGLQRVARAAPRRQLCAAGRDPREWHPRRDAQGPRATPRRWNRHPAGSAAQAPRRRAAAYAARKYLTTNINLWPRPLVLFMNEAAFAALEPVQREVLRDALRNALPKTLAASQSRERDAGVVLCRRG